MRPIISQVGTVTYETAKALNDLLKQYIPTKYIISSTQEFMHTLKSTANTGILASLDVESLFTNVPVRETTEIIINRAYNHETVSPPAIPKTSLEQLLLICTTETPFQDTIGDMYIQVDGVSMGSPSDLFLLTFTLLSWKTISFLSLNRRITSRLLPLCR